MSSVLIAGYYLDDRHKHENIYKYLYIGIALSIRALSLYRALCKKLKLATVFRYNFIAVILWSWNHAHEILSGDRAIVVYQRECLNLKVATISRICRCKNMHFISALRKNIFLWRNGFAWGCCCYRIKQLQQLNIIPGMITCGNFERQFKGIVNNFKLTLYCQLCPHWLKEQLVSPHMNISAYF